MTDERNESAKDHHKNGNNKLSEPSEVDPCIEEKQRGNRLLGDIEKVLQARTGLSRTWVRYVGALVVFAVLLVVVVIALASAWPVVPHHQKFPVCGSPACLRASAQIQENLNNSVLPCDDVWNWACGGWLEKNNLPSDKGVWNLKHQLAKHEATLVRDLITTLTLPLQGRTLEWNLMYFYESCMDIDMINIDNERPLTKIIWELGGWKITRNWDMAGHDGMALLINLHVQYGVSPYFKISVVPHPNLPGANIIEISPSGLGLPDRSYYFNRDNNDAIEKAYVQFISDVVINLSATKEEADRFGKDMYYYEKRIAEITPASIDLQDTISTRNIRKIQELTATVPQLYIHDILTKMYPRANIDGQTEVLLTSPNYIDEIARISTTTDRETANSYFIWTFVREYLPYISDKFTGSWDTFKTSLLGTRTHPERWEFCVNLIQRFMGLGVEMLMDKRSPVGNKTKNIVNEVYNSIRSVVDKRVEKYKTSPNLYMHLNKKVETLTLEVGLPRRIVQDEYIKNFYQKLRVLKKSFFQNYMNGITFLKAIEEERLVSNSTTDYLLAYIYDKPPTVQYVPSLNTIIVPNILLSDYYFEDEYAWPIIFGRLGVEIAEAMISSILPYDNFWTPDGKLLTEWHVIVNKSVSTTQKSKKCITAIMREHYSIKEETANLTALNLIKSISAVGIAEEALKNAVGSMVHIHQPSLETLEDPGVFYLTYSQKLCSNTSEQYKLYSSTRNYRLSNKELLLVLWSQIPGFRNAYGCSQDKIANCGDIF